MLFLPPPRPPATPGSVSAAEPQRGVSGAKPIPDRDGAHDAALRVAPRDGWFCRETPLQTPPGPCPTCSADANCRVGVARARASEPALDWTVRASGGRDRNYVLASIRQLRSPTVPGRWSRPQNASATQWASVACCAREPTRRHRQRTGRSAQAGLSLAEEFHLRKTSLPCRPGSRDPRSPGEGKNRATP